MSNVEQKIKVLHLIDSGGLYGAEKMLLALVAEQLHQGLDPMILSAGDLDLTDKAIEAEAGRLGLPVKPWRMSPGLNFKESLKILSWAKSQRFTHLHSHGYKFNLLMGLIPKFIRKLPLVTTVHGYVKAKRYSKMWLYELLDQMALKLMQYVVVVSKPMLKTGFSRSLNGKRLTYIANGLPLAAEGVEVKGTISDFYNKFTHCFCLIGRLSPEKNFSLAIEAMAELLKRNPKLSSSCGMIIIGEGRLYTDLVSQAGGLGVSDNVLLAGYQDRAGDIADKFTALIISSTTEGLPITLLEAMRSKALIISTRVGGIPSVLNTENSLLFDSGNAGQLADILEEVVKCPDEFEIKIEKSYRAFEEKYSSKEMSSKYLSVYHEVA